MLYLKEVVFAKDYDVLSSGGVANNLPSIEDVKNSLLLLYQHNIVSISLTAKDSAGAALSEKAKAFRYCACVDNYCFIPFALWGLSGNVCGPNSVRAVRALGRGNSWWHNKACFR